MAYLTERLARLSRITESIKAALQQKGQAVAADDPMEVYAEKVLAIATAPLFPLVTYSGDHVRRVVQYGSDWYYEWEMRSSGVLETAEPLTCDFYLVGGGGQGPTPQWNEDAQNYYTTGGGGAGYPETITGRHFTGHCNVLVGGSGANTTVAFGTQTFTANKGGDGNQSGYRGAGYSGTYHAYGDENVNVGQTTSGGITTQGAEGCSGLSPIHNGGAFVAPLAHRATGYGAGGEGTVGYSMTNWYFQIIPARPGVQGVVLMRVKMDLNDEVSMPARFDINATNGNLGAFTTTQYNGPSFRLNEDGELIMIEG